MRSIVHAADLFCGAGGTSTGLYNACREVGRTLDLLAVNHWPVAIESHRINHPGARHICARLESIRPEDAVPGGRLDIMVASPECTHHSIARGGRPVSDQLRASAWYLLRWVETLRVDSLLIENVREFRDWGPIGASGKPLKSRKGQTYQAFLNALRSLGYTVEYRVLNAADYGDATTRQRLFIMARKGRKPITWPEPTHGDPSLLGAREPYRTARQVIDWSIKSKSIFGRNKPLAPATMKRIEAGLRKFGGKNAEPFLVMFYKTNNSRSVDRPLPTVMTVDHIGLCQPFVLGQQSCAAPRSVDDPLPTIATKGAISLIEPFIVATDHKGGNGRYANGIDEPITTVTTKTRHALVEPFIVPFFGERDGQGARCHSVDRPLPTVTSHGAGALVEPFLTIMKGKSKTRGVDEPVPTLTTKPHLYLCEPFITRYNGSGCGAKSADEPLDTITTRDRFGLVEVSGRYQIDIRFRMLQPHELAAAMSLDGYELAGTKTDQVKQIGNAVPERLARALCRALLEGTR